jgi:hypothetical protein
MNKSTQTPDARGEGGLLACEDIDPSRAAGPEAAAAAPPELAPHLLPLSEQWGVWRTVGLRGAGFPAALVLKLSAPGCAAAADRLAEASDESARLREEVLTRLRLSLDGADESAHEPLRKALRRVRKGKAPELPDAEPETRAALEAWQEAARREQARGDEFRDAFEGAREDVSRACHEVASDPLFREAVLWQNRHAYETGVNSVLRHSGKGEKRHSKMRQHEELIANYLQRYCVKNDTIGFFGPVGWARFDPRQEAPVAVRPGPELLASRRVFWEAWGVDALAEKLSKNKSLKPWIAPRRVPFNYLERTTLHLPGGNRLQLSAKQAAVLRYCNGTRTAKEIATFLSGVLALGLSGEQEVYAVLEDLCANGVLAWSLEVPVEVNPLESLRAQLARVGDERLKAEAYAAVNELLSAHDEVAAAAGDPERLDPALSALEKSFRQLTGAAPTRGAGKTYAARTLVYEDCRRDVDASLGTDLLDTLRRPLTLLLTSARWVMHEVAELYLDASRKVYDELAKEHNSRVVNATDFWVKSNPLLYRDETRLADSVVPKLRARWDAVFALPEGARRVSYSSEELEPRVRETFAAPRAGRAFTCYHSPDVMIEAESFEAFRAGDYSLVMGEMHLGVNTLLAALFLAQHPAVAEIHEAVERDLPEERIVVVPPKHWPALTARTSMGYVSPKNMRLELSHDACGVNPSQSLPIGSLVIEDGPDGLFVRTRDGSRRFDLLEMFGEVLSGLVMNFFSILPPRPHNPRVTIDRLVVCREAWRFTPGELAFAAERDGAARFAAARRWARDRGLPRFVFVKSQVEKKPFYVDLGSPIYVDIFARIINRTAEKCGDARAIGVTEMIPNHEQAWLHDAEGQFYTSELRMIAVDLAN